jgi:oligoribonuclease NrnB/cAMP/cGMP phosphodiesterase (DHH superfamily)
MKYNCKYASFFGYRLVYRKVFFTIKKGCWNTLFREGGKCSMIKLFTDSDLDGVGCGILARLAFKDQVEISYCTYKNLNDRVEKFLNNEENNHTYMFVTDLAVNKENESRLQERYQSGRHVQMIDHHVTALHFNEYEWGFVQPEDKNGVKTCATSLFYHFLIEKGWLEERQALNEFVELVRQYDTWDWERTGNLHAKRLNDLFFMFEIEDFEKEMLMRLENESFSFSKEEELLLDVEEKKIERYIRSKNKQLVQTILGDYCIGIVYAEQYHSELGNALNKRHPHLDFIAIVNVGAKNIGFRTIHDDIDVSKFAAQFGGGGHPKASGCPLNEETFRLFVSNVFHLDPIKTDTENNQINVKQSDEGTFYQNRKGEFTLIAPHNHKWNIWHNGKLVDENFPTFEIAERYVKRHFASGVCSDIELLEHFKEKYALNEQEVRNFTMLKNKFING